MDGDSFWGDRLSVKEKDEDKDCGSNQRFPDLGKIPTFPLFFLPADAPNKH